MTIIVGCNIKTLNSKWLFVSFGDLCASFWSMIQLQALKTHDGLYVNITGQMPDARNICY